ncbi:unnamed protein product [Aureobasidium mustum]|uniref:Uncharacterized protein n=1 Tax=Aureobasidium mustum TaxID=2773714 RepID=A0A9N8K539_9PEZI|nr:unnamed protein product [Aureobasidium mustum]
MSDAQANAVAIIVRVFDTRLRDLEVDKLTKLASGLTQETTGFPTLTVTENLCKLLARSLSSNENDALFKTAMMLDDLWRNPRAYRTADGSADAPIAYLGRLSAGVVIDAVSKWHDIVDTAPTPGISAPVEGLSIGPRTPVSSSRAGFHHAGSFVTGNIAQCSSKEDYNWSLFDDDIFGSFDWYGETSYA